MVCRGGVAAAETTELGNNCPNYLQNFSGVWLRQTGLSIAVAPNTDYIFDFPVGEYGDGYQLPWNPARSNLSLQAGGRLATRLGSGNGISPQLGALTHLQFRWNSGPLTSISNWSISNATASGCGNDVYFFANITATPVVTVATVKTLATVNGVAATPTTVVNAGDILVYQLVSTNTGGASGSVTLSDPVPANTTKTGNEAAWSCGNNSIAGTPCTQTISVAANASLTTNYTVAVVSPLPATATTGIGNTATANGSTCSSCGPITNPAPNIDTVKTLLSINGVAATPTATVKAGDVLVYRLVSTNAGSASGTTVLSDPVPANTTKSGNEAGWSCANNAAAGTPCTQSVSVGTGASVTTNYTVAVVSPLPATATTGISNTATVTGGTCSSCGPITNPALYIDTVKTLLSINGAAATPSATVHAGDVLVYRLVSTNTGGTNGTTVLSDPVPDNTIKSGNEADWSCANNSTAGTPCMQTVSVAANASVTTHYTLTVVSALPATATTGISNTATSNSGTCSSCGPITNPAPNIDTVKTLLSINGAAATPSTTVQAGDVLVYRLVSTNTGNANGSVTLSDVVPDNTTKTGNEAGWSCGNNAAAGTSCTQSVSVGTGASVTTNYTVAVVSPLPATAATGISNTATANGGTCSSCGPVTNLVPNIDTVKTLLSINGSSAGVNAASIVRAGDVLVYRLVSTNTGGANGTTVLSDPVPANMTKTGNEAGWSCANNAAADTPCTQTVSVAANASVPTTYTVTVVSPLSATATTGISNTATATGGTCSSCGPVTNPAPNIDTVKTLLSINGAAATPSATVKAGDVLVYRLVSTNTGNANGSVTLSDVVPANTTKSASEAWSCADGAGTGAACTQSVSVAVGASVTTNYTMTVTPQLPAGATGISNTATSTHSCSACGPITNPAPNIDTVKTLLSINGVVAIAGGVIHPGDVVVYQLASTNTGNAAGSVILSDLVPVNATKSGGEPNWSCAGGAVSGTVCTQTVSVGVGATVTVNYTITTDAVLPPGTTSVLNTATSSGRCSACGPIAAPTARTGTVKTLAKINGVAPTTPSLARPGDALTYNLTSTNTSNTADNITLIDVVPANTTKSGSESGWSCADGAGAGTACSQSVGVGANATVVTTYTVKLIAQLPSGTAQVANTATSPNSTCTYCGPITIPAANIRTVKRLLSINGVAATPSSTVGAGAVLVYQLVSTNGGNQSDSVTLSDAVPTNMTKAGNEAGWSCPDGAVAGVACTQSVAVGAGATVTADYTVKVNAALPPSTSQVANTATSTGGCSDCGPIVNQKSNIGTVKSLATINGVAATANSVARPGDVLVYKLTSTNTTAAAGTITLSDAVPANTTKWGTEGGWSCADGAVAASACTQTVSVGVNAMVVVTYTVRLIAQLPSGTTQVANTAASTNECTSCGPITIPAANIHTVKKLLSVNGVAATPSSTVGAGAVLVYQLVSTNGGSQSDSVTLSDAVPTNMSKAGNEAGWSCADGALAGAACTQSVTVGAGATVTTNYTVKVNAALPSGTSQVANTATSTGGCSDCGPIVNQKSSIGTVKSLATINGVAATANSVARPSDLLVYKLTSTNTAATAGSITLSDAVPANTTKWGAEGGWSCADGATPRSACTQTVSVGANATVVTTYTVKLIAQLPSGTTQVANTAASTNECAGCGPITIPAANIHTVKKLLSVNGVAPTSASVALPNDVLIYQLVSDNRGSQSDSVILSDAVPTNTSKAGNESGWSCADGALAGAACTQSVTVGAGATVTTNYTVKVNAALPSGTSQVANTAASTGACADCGPIVISTKPDVSVTKALTSGQAVANAGEVLVYSITVTNTRANSTQPAGYKFLEVIPQGSTLVSIAGPGSSDCASGAAAGRLCTITVRNAVPANTPQVFTVRVIVATPIAVGVTQILNLAVGGSTPPNGCTPLNADGTCNTPPTCNSGAPGCVVVPTVDPGVKVTKTLTSGQTAGRPADRLVYSITLDNTVANTTQAAGFKFFEVIPQGARLVSITGPGTSNCSAGAVAGSLCAVTLGNALVAGTPQTFTVTVDVANPIPVGVTKIVNLAAAGPNPPVGCTPQNPDGTCPVPPDCTTAATPACVVLPVDGADIRLSKALTSGPNPAVAGASLVYTITLTNISAGTTRAPGYPFFEVIPQGTSLSGFTGPGTSDCVPGAAAGRLCTFAVNTAIAPGATVSFTVTVLVATPIPVGQTQILNVAAPGPTPPPGCSPLNAQGTCVTPPVCVAGTPGCVITPTVAPGVMASKALISGQSLATAGSTLVYAITLDNTADTEQAAGYKFFEVIPQGTTLVSITGPGFSSCGVGANAGTLCTVTTSHAVVKGTPQTFIVTVKVADALAASLTRILNLAASGPATPSGCSPLNADGRCPTPPECTAAANPGCVIMPTENAVLINKALSSGPNPATPGATLVYTLTMSNTVAGTVVAPGYQFFEVVPQGTSLVSITGPGSSNCAAGAAAGSLCTITTNAATAAGLSQVFTVTVRVASPIPSGLTRILNLAQAGPTPPAGCTPLQADGSCTTPPVCVASAPGCVITPSDAGTIGVTKALLSGTTAWPGASLVYAITVTNQSDTLTQAAGYRFFEVIPQFTSLVSITGPGSSNCVAGAVAGSLCTLTTSSALAPHATLTFSVSVQVAIQVPANVTEIMNLATTGPTAPQGCTTLQADGSCTAPPRCTTAANPGCTVTPLRAASSVLITKTTTLRRVKMGDFVPYTVRLQNIQGLALSQFSVLDNPAPGLSYVENSLRVAGANQATITSLRPLKMDGLSLAPNQVLTLTYLMRVGAAAGKGQLCNQVYVDDAKRQARSNIASACVSRASDPDFEDTRIFGMVFEDSNGNGVQDEGERGLPGVRVATATGYVAETDSLGRYHFEGIDPGAFARGSNFIVKLDENTLAKGSVLTTQNPLVKRLTWAIPGQFNFGVKQLYSQLYLYEAAVQRDTPLVPSVPVPQPPVQTPPYAFVTDGLFKFDKSSLEDIVEPGLSNLAHFVNRLRQDFSRIDQIVVKAHTDRHGSDTHNHELASKRAATVKAYLVKNGFDPQVIRDVAVGSAQPVVDCPGPKTAAVIACLAANRRFEILVQGLAAVRKDASSQLQNKQSQP